MNIEHAYQNICMHSKQNRISAEWTHLLDPDVRAIFELKTKKGLHRTTTVPLKAIFLFNLIYMSVDVGVGFKSDSSVCVVN